MVASAPLVWAEMSLLLRRIEPRHSIVEWLLTVVFVFAPLLVAVAVFWFGLCALKKERKVDHANSENRSDRTGP